MPAASKAQDDGPSFLNLPQGPAAGETDGDGVDRAGKTPTDGVRREQGKSKKPKAKPAPKDDPPREIGSGFDGLVKESASAALQLDRPRADENVVRAQAPAGGGQVPAVPAGEASNAVVDVLPLGKQSVAVTVDVQAPSTMNLNQEATLKLIVRNSGAHDASRL